MFELNYLLFSARALVIFSLLASLCLVVGSYLLYTRTNLPGRKSLFFSVIAALIYFLFDQSFHYIEWPRFINAFYFKSKSLAIGASYFIFALGFTRLCLYLVNNNIIIHKKD